jgi:DNA-binding transcriptional MerR regulator
MRIGELAKAVGLTVDTIRFYEKRKLLDSRHFVRSENNYREYTDAAVQRLKLIKQGQVVGLTLAEICYSINAWESNELTPQEKREFFDNKLLEIDARIAELEAMKAYIRKKIEMFSPESTTSR